jgi:hypothetical protein
LSSGSAPPPDNPIGFAKRCRDVRPFSVGKRPNWRMTPILCPTLRRRQAKHGARCHDNCALDDILQFSDIARPIMTFQILHHFFRDAIDQLAVSPGEFSNEVLD